MLATIFGLNRPSSGQYLQKKLKKAGAYNITRHYHGTPFKIITVLYSSYQL